MFRLKGIRLKEKTAVCVISLLTVPWSNDTHADTLTEKSICGIPKTEDGKRRRAGV